MRHNFRKSNFNRRAYRPLSQRNFADREGNNLVEKCRIINGNLFSNERDYLSPEELVAFFEKCRETWTCRNTSGAVHACNHLINVLEHYTGKSDVRPTSVAVYEPSMLVESSTVPEILIGKREPFDIVGSVKSCAENVAESFFDDQDQLGVLDEDTQSAYMDNDDDFLDVVEDDVREATFQAVKELADEEASFVNLVGNDFLLTDFDPEDYMDLEYDEVNQEEDPRLIELFEELYSNIVDEESAFCDAYENARHKFTNDLRYNKYDREYDEKKVDELVDLAKEEGIEEAVNSLDPKYDLNVLTGEQRLKHYELKNHLSDWEIVDSEESDKYFYDTIREEITKRMSWSNFSRRRLLKRRDRNKENNRLTQGNFTHYPVEWEMYEGMYPKDPLGKELYRAIKADSYEGVKKAIRDGADRDKDVDEHGYSLIPIITASAYGKVHAVEALIDCGADVNVRHGDGSTPLLVAAYNGYLNVVKVLVSAGADVNVEDRTVSVCDLALNQGHKKIARYLFKHGAYCTQRYLLNDY